MSTASSTGEAGRTHTAHRTRALYSTSQAYLASVFLLCGWLCLLPSDSVATEPIILYRQSHGAPVTATCRFDDCELHHGASTVCTPVNATWLIRQTPTSPLQAPDSAQLMLQTRQCQASNRQCTYTSHESGPLNATMEATLSAAGLNRFPGFDAPCVFNAIDCTSPVLCVSGPTVPPQSQVLKLRYPTINLLMDNASSSYEDEITFPVESSPNALYLDIRTLNFTFLIQGGAGTKLFNITGNRTATVSINSTMLYVRVPAEHGDTQRLLQVFAYVISNGKVIGRLYQQSLQAFPNSVPTPTATVTAKPTATVAAESTTTGPRMNKPTTNGSTETTTVTSATTTTDNSSIFTEQPGTSSNYGVTIGVPIAVLGLIFGSIFACVYRRYRSRKRKKASGS